MNIIIMGPPASGKGTISSKLSKDMELYHINTGDILRNEQSKGTKLGLLATRIIDKGGYMPDDIMIPLVRECIINSSDDNGRIFDGFPRTKEQAKQLHAFMTIRKEPIDVVIFLQTSKQTALERMKQRAETEGRADDNEQSMVNRWNEFEQKTLPLIEYFSKLGLIRIVDANDTKESVHKQVLDIIEEITERP